MPQIFLRRNMVNKFKKIISSQFIAPAVINPQTHDLAKYVVVITGASRGVGKAIADILLREEATVVVISRNIGDLQKAFLFTDRLLMLEGDVTSEADVLLMIKNIIHKFGKIDVLVNNVGKFNDKSLDEATPQEFSDIFNTNVKSMFLLAKYVLPHMKKRKQGFIINIGSKISHNTNIEPNKVLYAMTKYAVEGFSFALNKELKAFNIRVSCLMPGTISNFVSLKSKTFLSPSQIGLLVATMIKMEDVDFESIVIKSKYQNI